MDNRIIDALASLRDTYGDAVFYNHGKTRNLLRDLFPNLQKETIQVTNFMEMNGYFQLKHAGRTYPLVRARLIRQFTSTYFVDENVATWAVDVFGSLLGYSDIKDGAKYTREQKTAPAAPAEALTIKNETPRKQIPSVLIKPVEAEKPAEGGAYKKHGVASRISADFHSVALVRDGRVFAAGLNDDGQCDTFLWNNIIAVSAGTYFTVGLRADGTAAAVGRNDFGQCNVNGWMDIIQISAGARHTVGLRSDGTVVATGCNKDGECGVGNWRNVIRVKAGCQCTFGIKKDRRVIVRGKNKTTDLAVSHLTDVKDVANAAPGRSLALLTDGTLARVGQENLLSKNKNQLKDVIQIAAGPDYIAALLSDGRVRLPIYFWEDTGIECSADDWTDVAAIAAGRHHILGVQRDGRMLAAMLHPRNEMNKGQCDVGEWRIRV